MMAMKNFGTTNNTFMTRNFTNRGFVCRVENFITAL